MGKWLLTAASVLISFGVVMQSLSYFNLIPHTLVYLLLLMSAIVLSPWVPPVLLFFSFYDSLGAKLSHGTEFAITAVIIVTTYAFFVSPLMPWYSQGTFLYLGMIGFVFPFVVSAAILFLIKSIYKNGTKNEALYS